MSLSVGERLKSAREAKKLSIEEASGITKIQRQTLEAIEENRVQEAMDPVYARIFVRKYAVFLGVDGGALVNEYPGLSRGPGEGSLPPPQAAGQPSPRPVVPPFLLPAGIALAALVGIGFVGYMAVDLFHTLRQPRPPAPAAPAAPQQPKLLVPASKPLKLTVQTTADVWIQLKADGSVVFQNVLAKGSRESWVAKSDLELWTGNAGAMQLFLNGKPLEGLGRGVRKGVRITRAGLQ